MEIVECKTFGSDFNIYSYSSYTFQNKPYVLLSTVRTLYAITSNVTFESINPLNKSNMGIHSSYGFVHLGKEIWVLGFISIIEKRNGQLMFIINRDLQASVVISIEYLPFAIKSVRIINNH